MPEDYNTGYVWNPENGDYVIPRGEYDLFNTGINPYLASAYDRWLRTPTYYDSSLTDPAVVTAEMPAKFNGNQEAAKRYAEGYKWGQENVVAPREKAAPYVGAGLAAAFAAPAMIDLGASLAANPYAAINYMKETAPLWKAAARRMAIDLPAFEAVDRLPQAWGDERLTTQGTDLIKQTTPIGHIAPGVVDVAGPFIAGMVPGMAGDMMMRGAAKGALAGINYANGTHKRWAEAVLRMGDAARESGSMAESVLNIISGKELYPYKADGLTRKEALKKVFDSYKDLGHLSKQFLNKNTLRYIFDPKADPNLAYNMPIAYSGEVAGAKAPGGRGSAHRGDIIDQFLGKTRAPMEERVAIEDLPEDLQKYFREKYPKLKTVRTSDLGTTSLAPDLEYTYDSNGEMAIGETRKYLDMHASIPGKTWDEPLIDPGHHYNLYTRTGENTYEGYGRDVYKYNADDFEKANGYGSGLLAKLKKLGLGLVDSAGEPIVYKWHYDPRYLKPVSKISAYKSAEETVTKNIKEWFGHPDSMSQLMDAAKFGADLESILGTSTTQDAKIYSVLNGIEEVAAGLGKSMDSFSGTSINNAIDNLEVAAIMSGEGEKYYPKIDELKDAVKELGKIKPGGGNAGIDFKKWAKGTTVAEYLSPLFDDPEILKDIFNAASDSEQKALKDLAKSYYNNVQEYDDTKALQSIYEYIHGKELPEPPSEVIIEGMSPSEMGFYDINKKANFQTLSKEAAQKLANYIDSQKFTIEKAVNKKNKNYGGLIERLQKHYGDNGKVLDAINQARVYAKGGRKYDRNSKTDAGDLYYDIVRQRRNSAFNALLRSGETPENAARLAPMITTQQTMEGGWRLNRKDNNYGGMRAKGRTISYDSEDAFQDAYLKMLDSKWGEGRPSEYNWRSAQNLDDWARILNREDLGLHTQEDWTNYNKGRNGNDFVYLYAPEWENNNKPYREHLRKTEDLTKMYLDMLDRDEPYDKLVPMPHYELPEAVVTPDMQGKAKPVRMYNALIPSSVRSLINSREDGGLLLDYRSGGNLFWPGGPMNLTPYIPKVVTKGYGALRDILSGDPEKQKKVVEKYHENADKIPPKAHRFIYNVLKDSAFGGEPLSNIVPNAWYHLTHNKHWFDFSNHDNVFLMSPSQQEEELVKLGYKPIDTSEGYGLVNAAVNRYKEATGRSVPMYQLGNDEIDRKDVIPINNDLLNIHYANPDRAVEIEEGWTHFEPASNIGDSGSTPTRIYRDKDGQLYFKKWDFFDHGDYSRNSYKKDDDQYVTKSLTDNSQIYGNLLDIAGNPFVKVSGITKYPDQKEILQVFGNEKGYGLLLPSLFDEDAIKMEELKNQIKNGEFDIKANGGRIYIKPSHRGKFTALKKRTGHSASWFKAHGTPAQKKMAVFALNARKWKHADGGLIDRLNTHTGGDAAKMLELIQRARRG
jgi:hypothetical protein